MGDEETANWTARFDRLEALVKRNAQIARETSVNAATSAAIKVTAENTRAQGEIKTELMASQDKDRKAQKVIHDKVDVLGGQMNEVLITLNKISTQKMTEIGIVALILAALVVIGIKALGG